MSDNLIIGCPTPDILFSDHLALLFKLKTPQPPLKVGRVSFRKLQSIDKDAFTNEVYNSELFQLNNDDPDELAALFDNTLRSTSLSAIPFTNSTNRVLLKQANLPKIFLCWPLT